MQRIFVTRDLKADSPLRTMLSAYPVQITGHSLLRFDPSPFDRIPKVDWIFFYSPKAVAFFFRRVRELGVEPDGATQWGAIGPGTASALLDWGVVPAFTGTGDPRSTAERFGVVAAGRKVLFPRAARSQQSIQELLAGRIEALDLVVYQNAVDETVPRPEADILVFTSPLNARAYFQARRPGPGTAVVAIGWTTAAALRTLGCEEVIVATEPSEEGLAQAVRSALDRKNER